MTILWSNNASTTVSGSITAVSTTVALAAGTGVMFPAPTGSDYFVATFYDQATKTQYEIVHVTNVTGDVATIVRAQEGTTAEAWSAGDIFANLVTAGTLRNFVQSGAGPADTSIVYVGIDTSAVPDLVVCDTIPVPANYATGMLFNLWINNTNHGPTQLQLNGKPALAATRTDGSPLVGGNLTKSQEMAFIYNGVNFTSLVPPIPQQPPQTTFYVRTDGDDSHSGFANTPAEAFRTVSGAMHQIAARYISQQVITLRVADGFYVDGFSERFAYIAAWSIIGNSANPGAVIINATSLSEGAYPSPWAMPGSCCFAAGMAQMAVEGMTFQPYYSGASAHSGKLSIKNCNFVAPVAGTSPIGSAGGGSVTLVGNCGYSGSTPIPNLFGCTGGAVMYFGQWNPLGVAYSSPLVFNIAAGVAIGAGGIAASYSNGTMGVSPNVVSFTGAKVNCPQFTCHHGGGIVWGTDANIFPGLQPGITTAPGWTT